MTSPCEQTQTIKELEISQARLSDNQKQFMEMLVEVRDDVKEMKKFIFEWGMANNYVTKEMFNKTVEIFEIKLKDREEQIQKLEKNQNKVARLILSAVIVAVLALVITPKVI